MIACLLSSIVHIGRIQNRVLFMLTVPILWKDIEITIDRARARKCGGMNGRVVEERGSTEVMKDV